MYIEPWCDIEEYPNGHRYALESELRSEIGNEHILDNLDFELLAKRDDCDDVLVYSTERYFIIHLTWSGKTEHNPYPKTAVFESREALENKLTYDTELF